jgi:hypothetical protein
MVRFVICFVDESSKGLDADIRVILVFAFIIDMKASSQTAASKMNTIIRLPRSHLLRKGQRASERVFLDVYRRHILDTFQHYVYEAKRRDVAIYNTTKADDKITSLYFCLT